MSTFLNSKNFQIAAQEAKNMLVHSAEWRGRSIPKKERVWSFFQFLEFLKIVRQLFRWIL